MAKLTAPKPELVRDRFGRPMVVPPGGGKAVPYTRCTTYIDVLEDKYNLQKWMQRMVALGLASRPDLVLSVNAHRDDKAHLDRVCTDAREVAGATTSATTGTALHSLTQLIDEGGTLPDGLPANVRASLDAYVAATSELRATHIEQFCVLDSLKIGGTPDRVVAHNGARFIADLKTGSIEWGVLKIAMQLAVYARSHTYNIGDGSRGDHGADMERALIIHLPAVDDPADAVCQLHWVDISQGWQAVTVAKKVREQRALKFGQLTRPFTTAPDETALIIAKIHACTTEDGVREVWATHPHAWNDELTHAAKTHIAAL